MKLEILKNPELEWMCKCNSDGYKYYIHGRPYLSIDNL